MILVSHDMNFVYQVADKVLFLEKGHILEQGTPDEIFNHPKEERTKRIFSLLIQNNIFKMGDFCYNRKGNGDGATFLVHS